MIWLHILTLGILYIVRIENENSEFVDYIVKEYALIQLDVF